MSAKYLDYEPQNLAAAANDALDWLRFSYQRAPLNNENRRRLTQAIKALEKFLPNKPPVFEKTMEQGND